MVKAVSDTITLARVDDGVGIQNVTEYYAVSSSKTTAPTSWALDPPAMTATNKYLWNYETITYTDGSGLSTKKRVIGAYGDKGATGATGKGISSVTNYYLATASSSGVTAATSGWTSTIQSVTSSKKYLWNYETVTFTDKTTSSTEPCIIGSYGDKGEAGKGVKSTAITYQISSSATTAPTGTWTAAVPKTTAAAPYLWTRAIITYTDNTTSTLYSVGSTPEGIVVGGRNLMLGTAKWDASAWPDGVVPGSIAIEDGVAKMTAASTTKCAYIEVEQGGVYTVGIDVKADVTAETTPDSGVILLDFLNASHARVSYIWVPGTLSENWKRITYTFTVPKTTGLTELSVGLRNTKSINAVYFKNLKVETGNVATDWTPAPEDTENKLTEEINRAYTNFTTTASDIMFEAVKEYVKTSDLEVFRKEISTQFTQTAESIEMTFNQVVQRIEDLTDDTNGEFSEIKSYIRFEDGNIILGKDDNPLILTLKNNRISFTSADQEVAYFSDNRMFVSNVTITTSADIVGLKITQDTDNIFIDW